VSSEARLLGQFRARSWIRALVGLLVIMVIPYGVVFNESRNTGVLQITSILYTISSVSSGVFLNPVSIIAAVNVVLVVVPSLYLFYRRTHRARGESLNSLYAITAVLTTIVLLIVDGPAFYTNYQRDPIPVSTPNVQFLPGFGILVIVFYVLYPAIQEISSKQIRPRLSWHEATGPLAKLKTLVPTTIAGSLCLSLIMLPTIVYVSFTPNFSFSLFSSFYSFDTSTSVSSNAVANSASFYVCGEQVTTLVFLGMITNILLFVVLVLLFEGRTSHKAFILTGIVSLIPTLFFSFVTLFGGTFSYGIPLPLLQILSAYMIRQTEKANPLFSSAEEKRQKPEHVTVPVRYLLRSVFKRHDKSKGDFEHTDNEALELRNEGSDKQ
jgi:hypothetical protein